VTARTTTKTARVGLTLVAIYVAALGVTVALRTDQVRPLYDGFAPPASYRFVDPPPFFTPGNVEPAPTSESIALGTAGSAPAGIATPDGQFVISLGRGALPDARGASTVEVRVTPIAPAKLGPVPDGLRANGNAYRVEMSYQPRGGTVTTLEKPGSLLMEIPEIGDRLFASPDGKQWHATPARVITPRQLTMTSTLRVTGYYLAATSLPELAGPSTHSSHVALIVGAATIVVALVLFGIGYLIVRTRRA
jgi:hypothetical protein